MARKPTGDLRVTPPPRPDRDSGEMMSVDVEKLWKSIDKMASTINRSARHTEQIPDIKRKVEDTSVKVVELDTKMTTANTRITRVEDKVDEGYSCQKEDIISEIKENQREASQKIEHDVQKGVKQSGEIATLRKSQTSLETDVDDIKKVPRKLFFSFIVTLLTLGGGGIWFLAELSNAVEHERELRQEQFKRIETQIESVGNKSDNAPVQNAIAKLEDEIEETGIREKQYNGLCKDMTYYERKFVRTTLKRQNKSIPVSCLEQ